MLPFCKRHFRACRKNKQFWHYTIKSTSIGDDGKQTLIWIRWFRPIFSVCVLLDWSFRRCAFRRLPQSSPADLFLLFFYLNMYSRSLLHIHLASFPSCSIPSIKLAFALESLVVKAKEGLISNFKKPPILLHHCTKTTVVVSKNLFKHAKL
jgi:hypothetical protein